MTEEKIFEEKSYTFDCFCRILGRIKNGIWSGSGTFYGKYFELVFVSIVKTDN